MGITKAGREALEEEMAAREKEWEDGQVGEATIAQVSEMVRRGQKAQEGVDEIMADSNRNLDLKSLKEARAALRYLDQERETALRTIAGLTSRLGLTASERRI